VIFRLLSVDIGMYVAVVATAITGMHLAVAVAASIGMHLAFAISYRYESYRCILFYS
jgi:adenine/guanine phosphoribosyltransferase-like PRPP-binding protein